MITWTIFYLIRSKCWRRKMGWLSNWKSSLKYKISILYLILVVLPISVWGIMNIQLVTREVEDILLENTKTLVDKQLENIDDLYMKMTETASQLMLDTNVKKMLKNYTGIFDRDGIQMYNDMKKAMENIMIQSSEYSDMLMISERVLNSDENEKRAFVSTSYFGNVEDLKQARWYSYTEEMYDRPLFVQYDDEKSKKSKSELIFLAPYKDIGSNRKLGTLCIKISEKYLQKISEISSNDMNMQLAIYDQMGNSVLNTINDVKIEKAIRDKIGNSNANKEIFKESMNNKDYLIINKHSNISKFSITYVIPKLEFSRILYGVQKFNILVGIFCLVFSLAVLIIIYFKVLKPISKIQMEMEEVEKGNFEVSVLNYGNDEIGRLAISFSKMLKSIKDKNLQIINAEKKKREYEIKILQAQINPHFLYNTLDSIKWMAITKEEKTIERMAQALGQLLRKTISDNKEFVKIEEEMENIKCYMEIQQLRYYDSFDYIEYIDEDCRKAMIPRLTLQPLIENALFHGIYNCGRRGKILAEIQRDENSVQIVITDNGRGMDVKESLTEDRAKKSDGVSKIGIRNVNERIKLYYGESFGLSFESEEGKYTKVCLRIPYQIYTEREREDV